MPGNYSLLSELSTSNVLCVVCVSEASRRLWLSHWKQNWWRSREKFQTRLIRMPLSRAVCSQMKQKFSRWSAQLVTENCWPSVTDACNAVCYSSNDVLPSNSYYRENWKKTHKPVKLLFLIDVCLLIQENFKNIPLNYICKITCHWGFA